ncbi:MAG TPA: hypothetical protein VK716_12295 [Terracidiphilus sp.]|jgi:hypothetical protein|nr:hypothetical protein [Terracidiphilus sp.]
MKPIASLLLSLTVAVAASAQAVPDNPAPAPPADPAWSLLQTLPVGTPIVVSNTNGPPVHCAFVGATDIYLDCNPASQTAGVGYRFDRASVVGVDREEWHQSSAPTRKPERNYHPAWLSCMIAGGLIVGITATRTTDAGHAAGAGLLGAVVVGAIGAPLAFLPHAYAGYGPPAPPMVAIGIPLPLSAAAHAIYRLHGSR